MLSTSIGVSSARVIVLRSSCYEQILCWNSRGVTPDGCQGPAVTATTSSLLAYAFFYGVLFLYELLEWACCRPPGLVALTLSVDYAFADYDAGPERSGSSATLSLAVGDGLLLVACLASRLRKRYESGPGGRSLLVVAKKGYAEWCLTLEEQEQAERLSDAFW
ncbi:hypothetical protein PF006_g29608 [Phytophthora fragariae]|uniref:Uncharacterized protein n=1 Tax=Phytophthora fragariae TaxID=53985 RepID=A0A6A3Q5U6_9STRA|nr:hypothetical protein PF006_g29608 [Phytophthora fragariae]